MKPAPWLARQVEKGRTVPEALATPVIVIAILTMMARPIAAVLMASGRSTNSALADGFLNGVLSASLYLIGPLAAIGAVVIGVWLLSQRRLGRGGITLLCGLAASYVSWDTVSGTMASSRSRATTSALETAVPKILRGEGIVVRDLRVVEGEDRSVTLTGAVVDSATWRRAEETVRALPGVTGVVNQLVIR